MSDMDTTPLVTHYTSDGEPYEDNPPMTCDCGFFHYVPFNDCIHCVCGAILCNLTRPIL
jgi:hypothetical protein